VTKFSSGDEDIHIIQSMNFVNILVVPLIITRY
jgi:hypothetical protein